RMTEKPAASTCCWIALETLPSQPPGCALAMPAYRASSVTLIRRRPSGVTLPTPTVMPTSAQKPSRTRPRSRLTRSPLAILRLPGMPCTASSLIDTQIERGNPRLVPVVVEQRQRLFEVHLDAFLHRLRLVILALDEHGAVDRAPDGAGRVCLLVDRAGHAAGQPADELRGLHVHVDDVVEATAQLLEQ